MILCSSLFIGQLTAYRDCQFLPSVWMLITSELRNRFLWSWYWGYTLKIVRYFNCVAYWWQHDKLFLCTISREVRSSWMWRSATGWAVSDVTSIRCQTFTQLSSVTSQKAWILSNATVRISNILFKHVDVFEFWRFNSGVIEGFIRRRNLANKTGRQNRPRLLGTLIDEGVKLQRGGRLIWISPYYTYTSFPHFRPSFLCLFTAGVKRKLFWSTEKCVGCIHLPSLVPQVTPIVAVIWEVTLCRWAVVSWHFEGTCCLHRKGKSFRVLPFYRKVCVCSIIYVTCDALREFRTNLSCSSLWRTPLWSVRRKLGRRLYLIQELALLVCSFWAWYHMHWRGPIEQISTVVAH